MDIKKLLTQIDMINEGSMKKAEQHPTGPKFVGKWKGTDPASKSKSKLVGGESIIRELEKTITENPRLGIAKELAEDYRKFVNEYGSVPPQGVASQAPQGTTSQENDPATQQLKLDQDQIKKSTNTIAQTLSSQGTAQPLNKVKFQDVMTKLDATPNVDLGASDAKQLTQIGAAASKALQNPQTAGQLKQVITKADQLDQQKQAKVKQAQQQAGTNQPAGPAGQQPGQAQQPQPSAGQTR